MATSQDFPTDGFVSRSPLYTTATTSTAPGSPMKTVFNYNSILNGSGPIVSQHDQWKQELARLWNPGQANFHIAETIDYYLTLSPAPFRSVLYLVYTCSDFNQNKNNSLALFILRRFKQWKLLGNNAQRVGEIPDDFKCEAFTVLLSQKNTNMIDLGFEVFLLHESRDVLYDLVKELIWKKKYKEASYCAQILQFQEAFDITDTIIPLIFQDKTNLVDSYVAGYPKLQQALVKYLDYLCDRSTNIGQVIDSLHIPNIVRTNCNFRSIKKLAVRLMKKFNIPSELCPNIVQMKSVGALKYLLYKKYTEGEMDEENWDDMVKAAVGEDTSLQRELITLLTCYNDCSCAAKYALLYNIPTNELSPQVQDIIMNPNSSLYSDSTLNNNTVESWEDDLIGPSQYHELRLPPTSIILVENYAQFGIFMDALKKAHIIGIDAEWRPTLGLQEESLALLQIATCEYVFLLDIVMLLKCLQEKRWQELFLISFCNPDMLKLGFGIQTDLKMIMRTLPCTQALRQEVVNVLDLSLLCEKLFTAHPSMFPRGTSDEMGKGLSDYVHMCLGKPLNKSNQFSNWERRPLRDVQITYAALDAYCLLEIYDVLLEAASKQGIDISACIHICTQKKEKQRSKEAAKEIRHRQAKTPTKLLQASVSDHVVMPKRDVSYDQYASTSVVNNFDQVTFSIPAQHVVEKHPSQLAIVADTMLQGLGKRLRLCGVDVKILENNQDHEDAVKIAINENRVILTSGTPYLKLRQYVSEDRCYHVQPGSLDKQLINVLEHFHVSVSASDILSRCQICNNSEYVMVPSLDMKAIWREYGGEVGYASYLKNQNGIARFRGGTLNLANFTTSSGKALKMDCLRFSTFGQVDVFFICSRCGKVYWIGGHSERAKCSLGSVLKLR